MFWLIAGVAMAARGDVATRDGLRYWDEQADRGGTIVVVADIAAPTERVLDVIMDVEARWTDVSALRSATVTQSDGPRLDVGYVFHCATGMQHAFDLNYELDGEARVVRFAVNPDKPGFFEVMNGSYRVSPTATGGSLLTYTSATQKIDGIRRRSEEDLGMPRP